MMRCEHACDKLSDYLEGGLDRSTRQAVGMHLETCVSCAHKEQQLTALLTLLHERIPRREPVLDIWRELEPKIEVIRADQRRSISERFRNQVDHFLNRVATGAILFTHALAFNTTAQMQRYLLHDPFHLVEEEAR